MGPGIVHGESGLDGAELPEPAASPRPESAVEFMAALLRAAPERMTLVPTGPLTNIALLLRAVPGLRDRIAGAINTDGRVASASATRRPPAEYNVWQEDPEAAAIGVRSGVPLAMAGLDVTHQALMLPPDIARLEAAGTRDRTGVRKVPDAVLRRASPARYGWDGRRSTTPSPCCC